MRYRTSPALVERRIDALEPYVPYTRALRLMLGPAEQPQVPLFRVCPCTREVLSGDRPGQPSTHTRRGRGSNRQQKQPTLF